MPARRFCCLVLVGLAAACEPAVQPPGFEGGVPRLVADVGIGPFAVGMTRAQCEAAAAAAGLTVRPGFSEANAYAGPYFVAFTDSDGGMSTVLAPFAEIGGVVFEGQVLPPILGQAPPPGVGGAKAVAAKLRGCGALEVGSGAGWHACAGRISVEVAGMEGTVSVRVQSAEAMRDREP
ncbi:hypothetical protein OV203_11440 [Nannocystis sp. ILAH1]|uniref:hypothetical protein n=1 Tax=unclassified Nannocystis TaxID=2627009 RepID=UPI00227003F7|nr:MULTISPECIES: hypothetical protein [unclassified Nannocystis]MCY0987742.1 hypothetical protein [Nannocystis sp. ILAH1]MCY1070457.1 hypothetical protein [Nannocystis sp. RBIL2]